jgi:hypothetical protein
MTKTSQEPQRVPEPNPNYSHRCLIRAWEDFRTKDPVDAVNDAEHLLALCRQRLGLNGRS